MRGQGYDGAAVMSSRFRGAQAYIAEQYPTACYIHCTSHSLNFAISNASEVRSIRNCFGNIENLYTFFKKPKRQKVLMQNTEELDTDEQKLKLNELYSTH